MSGFVKKECPVCGEMVSTHPRWWKEHEASHEQVQEPKTEGAEEVTAVAEIKEVVATKETDLSKMKNQDEKELVMAALRKQAELKKAPNVLTNLVSGDENMELRKTYAPDTIPVVDERGKVVKREDRHAFIADGKNLRKYVDRGYVPVLNEHGDLVRTGNGDVLCTLDMDIHDAINDAIEKENMKHDQHKKRLAVGKSTTSVRDANGNVSDGLGDFDASNLEVDVTEQKVGWTKE